SGGLAPAVGEDLPAVRLTGTGDALGINGHDNALRAEAVGGFADEVRVEYRGRVDGYLVGPGVEQVADILHGAHATADGMRDEHLAGHALDGTQGVIAAFMGGGGVAEGDLDGTPLVVAAGDLHRIAGVTTVLVLHALDRPAAF